MTTAAHNEPLRTDHERLMRTFDQLRGIGAQEDGSIDRRAFSEADMAARRWLVDEAKQRGLEARLDPAANVIVRSPDADPNVAPVLTGSHLDSVPSGGTFDGALGVVIGLECLSTLQDRALLETNPVELAAFSDEEGRFGGMFGSRAIAGRLTPDDIAKASDLDGITLIDAMAEHGLSAVGALDARRAPGAFRAFLEVHIEQGPLLEGSRERIGVVHEVAGLFKWSVTLRGQADHAGTTPMDMRRDAFHGLAEFSCRIPEILGDHGSNTSTATIGRVDLHPGAANSVPGQATFTLEARDTDPAVLEELRKAFRRQLSRLARARNLMFEFDELERIEPTRCDPAVIEAINHATDALELDALTMHSGAVHDAEMIAGIAPVGMIFTPSVGGRSHSVAEWTHRKDIELAADVAVNALRELATENVSELPDPADGEQPHKADSN